MSFNPELPCRQKNGRKAEVLTRRRLPSGGNDIYPLIVVSENSDGSENIALYTLGGMIREGKPHSVDLVNIRREVDMWGNLNREPVTGCTHVGRLYATEEAAFRDRASYGYLATVNVKWADA